MNIRRISFPHLYNFRDLGGYEANGAVTSFGRLFRGDCPSKLTPEEWDRLKEMGVLQLIDLRSTYEVREDPVNCPDGIDYHHCPFLPEDHSIKDPGLASKKFLESLSLDYSFMLKRSLETAAKALSLITECLSKGNVYFFCTAGKDRTGIIAAAVLYLCGVAPEDIIADYCITEIYNADVIAERINSLPEDMRAQISPESLEQASASKAFTMKDLLGWMDENDFPALMQENGFGTEGREALRSALTIRS